MIVVWFFLTVPCVCLQFVIVVFPHHIHLLFLIEKVESYSIYLNAMNQNDLIHNQTYYSVYFIFLSFGIMDYIVESLNQFRVTNDA